MSLEGEGAPRAAKRMSEKKELVIKLFGRGQGDAAYEQVRRAAEAAAGSLQGAEVKLEEHPEDDEEARFYGVVLSPTVVVNDTIVSVGKPLAAGRLLRLLRAELDAAEAGAG